MYHREQSITPTQQAVNGALDLFVEAALRNQAAHQLIGLRVVASATEEQVVAAILYVERCRGISAAKIRALLTGSP